MSEQINKVDETWVYVRNSTVKKNIVAFSNRGNVMYGDGRIKAFGMYSRIILNGKQYMLSHLVAEHFAPCSDKSKILVDHITHSPEGMNINDVRNLRWCTHKENSNFGEAKLNMSQSTTGVARTEFGEKFLPFISGKVKGENMNEYAWARNYFKRTGRVPTHEEYTHVHKGKTSEFSVWFNDRYGSGNENRALYQRCRRYYIKTGEFLEV